MQKTTIGGKLGLGFATVILLMLVSAAIAYVTLAGMDDSLTAMSDEAVPVVRASDDLLIGLNLASSAVRGYLLVGADADREADFHQSWTRAWSDVNAAAAELERLFAATTSPTDEEQLATIRAALPPFEAAQQRVMAARQAAGEGAGQELQQAIDLWESEAAAQAQSIRQAVERLRSAAVTRMNAAREDVERAADLVRWTLLISTLVAGAVAAVIAVVLSRGIVSSLQVLLTRVRSVAEGELRGEALAAGSSDEVGELAKGFNQMIVSLREVLSQATTMTGEVAAASSQIATGAQEQLSSLTETASSLNEITATSEQFKATMQEFADRARALQDAADETANRSADGRQLTRDSAARIERVRTNAQAAGESVLHLSEQMQRIGEITATVNEIAEQTKLLALNASIEAARAGEEGRGFAVVATQVRELANQSKDAVARIEGLISDTQKSMQDVVRKIEEGGQLSEDSADIVRRLSQAFEEIAQAVDQSREAMAQISTGAKQQEQGISELVGSISQIDSAQKESLAAAEQTQKSIVAIDQRIRSLNDAIARFKV
ncbi:MAG: HAMP domain-containing protein [Planctomycetes bacterium]|nr:HAMP domain-containing protein [Planctomycetota bacterium]